MESAVPPLHDSNRCEAGFPLASSASKGPRLTWQSALDGRRHGFERSWTRVVPAD